MSALVEQVAAIIREQTKASPFFALPAARAIIPLVLEHERARPHRCPNCRVTYQLVTDVDAQIRAGGTDAE